MKIALLSNVTTSVLESVLSETAEVWSPPGFGSWIEISLSPPEEMRAFAPDKICILIDSKYGEEHFPIADAVKSLNEYFPSVPVCVIDLKALADEIGSEFYDERMWQLAKMPWSLKAIKEIAKVLSPIKKVVAVDFDGTLWNGVVGEEEIIPCTQFQEQLLELKNRGILLVALSKNNLKDIESVWRKEGMVLSPSDFAAMRIDWNSKAENLLSIADELNLSTDSFVFVDDNPSERAEMRAHVPSVSVSPFPIDLSVYFPPSEATEEGSKRTLHYQSEAQRKEFSAGKKLEDYLEGLQMRITLKVMEEKDIPRVAELSQRSNQFNVATNRYTENDLKAFLDDPKRLITVLSVADRFGDLGLVAFMQVCNGEIIDWVMSCRAMNRRLEFALQEFTEKKLVSMGEKSLKAFWRRTAKNAPVKDLYERLSFNLISETEEEKHYERILG